MTMMVSQSTTKLEGLANTRFGSIALAILATIVATLLWLAPLPVPAMAKPFLVCGVAFLPFAGILAFRFVFYIVLLFLGFSFFRFHEVFRPIQHFRFPLMLALGVLISLSFHLFLSKSIKPYWESVFTPFVIFVAIGIVSMGFAIDFGKAFGYFNATFSKIVIMVFAMAWIITQPKQFIIASRFIVISGIIVGIVAIYNKLNGIGLVEGTRVTIGRDIRSALGDPNDLALRLLFPISFALSLVMVPKSKSDKLLGAVGTFLITWAIIATQSRGGLLGLIAVFGIIGHRYIKSKVILGAVGGIGLIALAAMAGLGDRKSGSLDQGIDASAQSRLHSWEAAWNMAISNPITGVGYDNYFVNYFYYTPHWDGKPHAVHSTWFGVLAETGFFGFAAFVAMIGYMIYFNIKNGKLLNERHAPEAVRAASLALITGVVGVCISGSFLTQGFTWPIYVLLALTASLCRYTTMFKNETQENWDKGVYATIPVQEPQKANPDHVWQPPKTKQSKILWEPSSNMRPQED